MHLTQKQKLLYIIAAGVLILVYVLLTTIVFFPDNPVVGTIFPTPTPATLPRSPDAMSNPPVLYPRDSREKIVALTRDRQPLPKTDQEARKRITDKLVGRRGQASGYVYTSQQVRIEYLKTADVFHAEIMTRNISQAKQEAVTWFINQRVSQDGICRLPLIFYLNRSVADSLRQQNIVFDPLPDNC